jgi:hypothetical protein
MKLITRMPYAIHPAEPDSGKPVLLFLHGVGEGFINNAQIGHGNLFLQGPPKFVDYLQLKHPLRAAFTLIAPQLHDRDTLWGDVIGDLNEILARHRRGDVKLFVMGFSKGGLGAFQVAPSLGANAVVTIDASPMKLNLTDAVRVVKSDKQPPFWAIYTTHLDEDARDKLQKIRRFHDAMDVPMYDPWPQEPPPHRSVRTLHAAPEEVLEITTQHPWIGDQVSTSEAPYRWLLKH